MSSYSIPPTVAAFSQHEEVLRAAHGPLSLYVRPIAKALARAPRGGVVVGGWAYLDGEPALIAEGLDLLVLTLDGPEGLQIYPRDPAAVLDALAPYVTRYSEPCVHLAISVPDAARPELRDRLIALPDHDGVTAPALQPVPGRAVYPVLEQAGWPHRLHVVHAPLFDHPEAPIVAFAHDTPQGRAYVMTGNAPGADPVAMLADAARNLGTLPFDLSMLFRGVAATVGREFSAERLIDPTFHAAIHQLLGPELWIAVPHRFALYAVAVGAAPDELAAFRTVVQHELDRASSSGYPRMTGLAFQVVDGRIVGALPVEAVDTAAAAARGLAPGIPHPSTLPLVDRAQAEINASILITGVGAKRLARAIHEMGAVAATEEGSDGPGTLAHACVTLGAIRGWTTRLYLYAFEPEATASAAALASTVTAVVISHGAASGWPEPAVAAIGRTAAANGSVVAVIGPPNAAAALAGVTPQVIAAYDQDAPRSILKEIVRYVLTRLPAAA